MSKIIADPSIVVSSNVICSVGYVSTCVFAAIALCYDAIWLEYLQGLPVVVAPIGLIVSQWPGIG